MALLWYDGFDHYASGDMSLVYNTVQAASISTARNGAGGLAVVYPGFDGFVRKTVTPSGTTVVFGGAYLFTSNFSGVHGVFAVVNAGTYLFSCAIDGSTNKLKVLRGDGNGTLLNTGTNVLTAAIWYYIEGKVVLASGATGSYEIRINEATELTGSSVQTSASGTTWDTFQICQTRGTFGTARYDDVYVCDGSGSLNNDFLGDCLVETKFPSTDAVAAGSNASLTPSTGTDHGALVDEATPNTSDYNSSAVVGNKDTYQYPDLATTGGSVKGVQVHLFVAKSTPGTRSICPVVRHAGVDYDGVDRNPSQTFTYYSQIYENNPGTSSPWTISEVNAAQFGMKISA